MFTFKVLKRFRKTFGSWATATPPRPKPRPTFKPRLEPLEERWCPDASTDTLTWNPVVPSADATKAANWYDDTQHLQGVTAPGPGNSIYLDGGFSNSAIEIPAHMSVASISVVNNYNNTLTIDPGDYIASSSTINIFPGTTLNEVDINTATVPSGGIKLADGAVLYVQGALTLSDAAGSTLGSTFISPADNVVGAFLNIQGLVKWSGIAGVSDGIGVPVRDSGSFNLNGGGGTRLVITGANGNTNNVSLALSGGTMNLTNATTLVCMSNFYMSGDIYTDALGETVQAGPDGSPGDINVDGGAIFIDQNDPGTVTNLYFIAKTVEFDGSLYVNGLTQGGNSISCDELVCEGAAVTFGPNAYLNVGTTGTEPLGTGNRWEVMSYASETGGWSGWTVPSGMNNPSTGQYDVLVTN